jgi:transcriptional regulator with XRE-family HTH domain
MPDTKTALTWGRQTETLRVLRGWSQSQLAEAAGISQSSLSEYESGREPMASVRQRVEKALGLGALSETAHDLLEWLLQRMEGRWKATTLVEDELLISEAVEEMRRMFEATLRGGMAEIRRLMELEGTRRSLRE